MPARHLDLLLDQVKIIEQPLRRRGDPPALVYRQGGMVEGLEDLLVMIQPRQEPVAAPPGRDLVLSSDRLRMPRQLFDAEQLRAQRRLTRTPRPTFRPRCS